MFFLSHRLVRWSGNGPGVKESIAICSFFKLEHRWPPVSQLQKASMTGRWTHRRLADRVSTSSLPLRHFSMLSNSRQPSCFLRRRTFRVAYRSDWDFNRISAAIQLSHRGQYVRQARLFSTTIKNGTSVGYTPQTDREGTRGTHFLPSLQLWPLPKSVPILPPRNPKYLHTAPAESSALYRPHEIP